MKLSVITVNLNNATGLRKTMESVLCQTFNDFEYIIIDGASKDKSIETIQHITQSTNRQIFWLSEPDSGIYEAMNKGIKLSQGEYLLFLNSGDYLVNEKLLVDVFSEPHDADFLLGKCRISNKGNEEHITTPPPKLTFGYLYNTGLAHQSTFIKRELFSKFGYYREDFKYNSDIEFWIRTIIISSCSTETLTAVISDYNLDGISTLDCKTDVFNNEIKIINSNSILQNFIPDYDAWNKERESMSMYYWGKQKQLLNFFIKLIYFLAIQYTKIKKKKKDNVRYICNL